MDLVERSQDDGVAIGAGFFQDFGHGVDEVVHGFLGFGFGGLDQEAFGHQQREVDGWGRAGCNRAGAWRCRGR